MTKSPAPIDSAKVEDTGEPKAYSVYFNRAFMLTVTAPGAQDAIDSVAGYPAGNHPLYRAIEL